ncbi:MAG: sigma-70 family RNA polymerase sigma factor [Myxococcales bacterium]
MDSTRSSSRPPPPAAVPAERLVGAARAGDRRAFGELARRYRPRLFALSLHVTGSRSDADDVVQEALLRAFRRIGDFRGESQFFTWLYRITLNRALNHKRDRGRRRAVSLHDDRLVAALQVDAEGDPRRACELAESYATLLAALDRLTPSLRTTVILVSIQGLSHRETARLLDTTEGTVGWRMHEARRRLRAAMEAAEPTARRSRGSIVERLERLLDPALWAEPDLHPR